MPEIGPPKISEKEYLKGDDEDLIALYGLPKEVKFCKRCVISNQRPASAVEFKHDINTKKQTIHFDEEGICDACRMHEKKEREIDWKKREKELFALCDKYRKSDGSYDCVVPGSGGKDSVRAAWLLKYKYKMHPLTVTWAPHMYTPYGWRNFQKWISKGGFDNMLFSPNGQVHRLLTRLAFQNILHPFQPFILGQKNIGAKISAKYSIPLVFYGENEAEYGNPLRDNVTALRDARYCLGANYDEMALGGVKVNSLIKDYGLCMNDLLPYLPMDPKEYERAKTQVHYMGYYERWDPQESFYFAVEKTGFETNDQRTEGTYSKYSSLDDKIDPHYYWTIYLKFGIGRTTSDASQEIRNGKITREEGVALVKKFDAEYPVRYKKEVLEYLDMDEKELIETADKFRSPHLWKKEHGEWKLRHKVYED